MLLQETCWQCVLSSQQMTSSLSPRLSVSLRWLLLFQGCFFKALQKELPGQAASPPASCAFDLI